LEAECSSPEDQRLICAAIEARQKGYKVVDRSIKMTMRFAGVPLLLTLIFQCWAFALMTVLWPAASRQVIEKGIELQVGHVIGNVCGVAILYCSFYYTAWKATGHREQHHVAASDDLLARDRDVRRWLCWPRGP